MRDLILYLPPSYSANPDKRYPVLYMHDGQNLFDRATSFGGVEWQVDETFNKLIGEGRVQEAIVVGINNTSGRIDEYTPTQDPGYGGGDGDSYLDFIEQDVKPYIDANYRTQVGPRTTMMLGSSLGGLIKLLRRLDAQRRLRGRGLHVEQLLVERRAADARGRGLLGLEGAGALLPGLGRPERRSGPDQPHGRDALVADGYQHGVDLNYCTRRARATTRPPGQRGCTGR